MAFKVFDLQCEHGHVFEGWFASHEDYDSQQDRGLIACPVCHSPQISKRLSAPRLNVAHLQAQQPAAKPAEVPNDATCLANIQAAVLKQVREWVRNADNVGKRFAEEARRIHQGEVAERPIRGIATPEERLALVEEGIEIVTLPDFLDDEHLQ
jgi:hypothetical protein